MPPARPARRFELCLPACSPAGVLASPIQVFPATHFEDFLVHHRANNKAGRRGESIPGVPIRTLREWVEQFIRDESFLEPHD